MNTSRYSNHSAEHIPDRSPVHTPDGPETHASNRSSRHSRRDLLRRALPSLAIGAFAALCLLLNVMIFVRPGHTYYAYAPYSFFILQPEMVTGENIPDHAGVRRTYTFTIPEGHITETGARLTFYLRHTEARVMFEDTEDVFYDSSEMDDPHVGHTPGNYWVSIPVRPVYAGRTVHVTLTPVFPSVADEIPVFWLIGHEQLLNMIILPQDSLLLGMCVFSILAGLFITILVLVLPLDRGAKHRTFLLGALAITAGLWKMAGLPSTTLLLDSFGWHKAIWYFGSAMYLLMLSLSLLFLTTLEEKKNSRRAQLYYYSGVGAAVLLVTLQLFNVIELHETLVWYGFFMVTLHLAALFGHRPSRSELLWSVPFIMTIGGDMLLYGTHGNLRHAPFFLLWSVVNLSVRGISFVRDAILRERLLAQRESDLRETKVQAMIAQIRPHFIYNTLTSIYVLIHDDPKRAMLVTQDFTDYLQANFSAIAATKPISFSDELRHTRAYLAVESMRFGDDLHVDFAIEHSAFLLPALTLQPIVENAVKYGVGRGHAPEHITIRTQTRNGCSIITVTDDGPGFTPDAGDGEAHVGIANVRERLSVMCGGTLEIESCTGQRTTVKIIIPV